MSPTGGINSFFYNYSDVFLSVYASANSESKINSTPSNICDFLDRQYSAELSLNFLLPT